MCTSLVLPLPYYTLSVSRCNNLALFEVTPLLIVIWLLINVSVIVLSYEGYRPFSPIGHCSLHVAMARLALVATLLLLVNRGRFLITSSKLVFLSWSNFCRCENWPERAADVMTSTPLDLIVDHFSEFWVNIERNGANASDPTVVIKHG